MNVRLPVMAAFFILLAGCNSPDLKQDYTNSGTAAFSLVKLCVDKMLGIDTSINTQNYVVDLSGISSLNKNGVDSFINVKNKTLPVTAEDSVMLNEGAEGNFKMKKSIMIRIESIETNPDFTVEVLVSKTRSSTETAKAYITLKRSLNGYRIIGFERNKHDSE